MTAPPSSSVPARAGSTAPAAVPGLLAGPPARPEGSGRLPWILAGCLALAALSLLGHNEPTYDPWAWIIWGREVVEGALDTREGPSWKPLPVLFTAPFALLGDDLAPALWLVVARAGGLLALVMAYRLGARLAGRAAGVLAALSLLVAEQLLRNVARGNSEGLLVALCLLAAERHLDAHRGQAFACGLGAALLRPEVWPFVGLYGLWVAWRQPRLWGPVLAAGAGLGVLWFVPEWIGSGDFLRAAERARTPNPDSAAFAPSPFLEVFKRSWPILPPPVLLGALLGVGVGWRERHERRGRLLLALGAGAAVLMLAVAVMTEFRFAGNLRYVALPAALVCVLGGAGWVGVVRAVAARLGARRGPALAAGLALAAAPFSLGAVVDFGEQFGQLSREARFYDEIPVLVERLGGPERVRECGGLYTGDFQVQALAWALHVPGRGVDIPPGVRPPGTVFAPPWLPELSEDERFPEAFTTGEWIVRQRCRT